MKKIWNISLPLTPEQLQMCEINDFWIDNESEIIYVACANSVYKCSLEDGSIIQSFQGHKDYIHSVDGNGSAIITSSEDGSVKIWDTRTNTVTTTIEPYKLPNKKEGFGKFIASACINDKWFAFGGGSCEASLYNLNQTMKPFETFNFPKEIHVTKFIELDNLLIAGQANQVTQYSFKGDLTSDIETTGPAIYSVEFVKGPDSKFMAAAGASNCIDVTTNFTFKDATLNFYAKI
jgi:THO complex subunit 6